MKRRLGPGGAAPQRKGFGCQGPGYLICLDFHTPFVVHLLLMAVRQQTSKEEPSLAVFAWTRD